MSEQLPISASKLEAGGDEAVKEAWQLLPGCDAIYLTCLSGSPGNFSPEVGLLSTEQTFCQKETFLEVLEVSVLFLAASAENQRQSLGVGSGWRRS